MQMKDSQMSHLKYSPCDLERTSTGMLLMKTNFPRFRNINIKEKESAKQ